ncbi:MAG: restriction endonuclease [Candidatus Diapherotrites archaeon]|nr:restriction endonuclease [Candidatus Diapherotrites archaeon]
MLLELILNNLYKLDLTLIKYRTATERGIDIVAKKNNALVGIELKAYNSGEALKTKDFKQVKKAIVNENLDKALIITTTSKVNKQVKPNNQIQIINYDQLSYLLGETALETLNYIRNSSVNKISITREINKKRILNYIFTEYSTNGRKPCCNDIAKDLRLHIYTYFDSLFTIYKTLNILPPTTKMKGTRSKQPDKELIEMWKTEFKKYILEEVKYDRYPSGEKVGKHLGVSHIWNIVKISDLYKELGLIPYRERSKRKLTLRAES